MTLAINGTTGITLDTQFNSASTFGFKNRIINGGMVIDQRNAGASVSETDGSFGVDRWQVYSTAASKFTLQQNAGSVTPPVGFSYYQGCTSSAATTVASGDSYSVAQKIEGYNFADLGWGTANAKTVTLSAWVYSSLTGTFGGSLANSALNRSYPFTFTISSANTWTQISITVAGDTSGTWLTTNGTGCRVIFNLGSGSTYSGTAGAWASADYRTATSTVQVVATNGATFYITGVQLEKGSIATTFDYRPYGTELALCQRYLPAFNGVGQFGVGFMNSATTTYFYVKFPVSARVAPTGISYSNLTHFADIWSGSSQSFSAISFTTSNQAGTEGAGINTTTTAGTANAAVIGYINNTAGQLLFTGCEL